MNEYERLGFGLGGLPLLGNVRTRSFCPENPSGGKRKGGMAVPDVATLPFSAAASDLGQGWKANPFLKVKSSETVTLMDVDGPGVIQHIWLVADPAKGRSHVLRVYWDGEETPSIGAPVSSPAVASWKGGCTSCPSPSPAPSWPAECVTCWTRAREASCGAGTVPPRREPGVVRS